MGPGRGAPLETPHDFALLGCVCDVMVIPGRVGLVAVDAMALGLPLVTTKHDAHAPELRAIGMKSAARAIGDSALATWLTVAAPRAVVAGAPLPQRPATSKRGRFFGR